MSNLGASKVYKIGQIVEILPESGVIGIGGMLSDRKPWSVLHGLSKHIIANDYALLTFMGSFEIDLLCKLGFSGEIISSAVTLEVLGMAKYFREAVENGQVSMVEYSELAFIGALKAACMNMPFFPLRALFGTDIIDKIHPNWKVQKSPYSKDPYVAVPPFTIDVAFLHAQKADESGNIHLDSPNAGPYTTGRDYDLMLAKASQKTIVSVEEIVPQSVIRENPGKTVIPGFLVDAVIHSPGGAKPGSFLPFYPSDLEAMIELLNMEVVMNE